MYFYNHLPILILFWYHSIEHNNIVYAKYKLLNNKYIIYNMYTYFLYQYIIFISVIIVHFYLLL